MVDLSRFVVLVLVLITNSESVLLVKHSHINDTWGLAGGLVEYGQQVDDAAVAYVRDQTGLDAELSRILAIYTSEDEETLTIVFKGTPTRADPHIDEGRQETVRYYGLEELPAMEGDHSDYLDALLGNTGGVLFEARR